ncbi:MAG TPA: MFS transporter [Steroidobacteraceae bacterium]|jgi:predicted MFS family arabinose efflux permease
MARWRDDGARGPGGGLSPHAFLLALATFAIGTDAFIVAGLLPQIAHDLSTPIGSAGLVVSVFSVSYAISAPIVSALTARISRKVVLVGGLAVFTVANVLSAICTTLPTLLLTRVLAALSAGLVTPTCYAVASSLGSQSNRGRNLAVTAAGFTTAIVLGVPFGVYISHLFSWRGSLGFVALLATVAGLALLKIGVPSANTAGPPVSLAQQFASIARPKTLFVLVPFLFWSAATLGLYTYVAAILARSLSAQIIPILLLAYGMGAVIGNLVGGFLADRLGLRAPTMGLLALLAVTLGSVGVASSSLVAAATVMMIWAVCGAGLFTLQQQRAIASSAQHSGLILALNNSALYFGAAAGSAFLGSVISMISLSAAAPASAAIAALAWILLVTLPQPRSESSVEHSEGVVPG